MPTFARQVDAIPVVNTAAERAVLYPSPEQNQRVQNLETGFIERWTNGAWTPDYEFAAGGAINVKTYGAVGDGVTDDTAAIQAAVTAMAAGDRLVFPAGNTFLVSANVTKSSVDDLSVVAYGATLYTTDMSLTGVFTFTSCDRLTWEGGYFLGTEDNTYFQANTPSEERSFIYLNACEKSSVRGVRGAGKRRLITALDCHYLCLDDYQMTGFFQNLSSGAVANGNHAPTATLRGCDYAHASNGRANNCGSVLLGQLTGAHCTVSDIAGHDLHDNGVYVSSGNGWTIDNVTVRSCVGNAVQTRGNNHTITNVVGIDIPTDYAVDMTGPSDAAGYGQTCANVVSDACLGVVSIGDNGGFYCSDITVSNITASNSTGTGLADSPVEVIANGGINLSNIVIRTTGADMGILVGGVDAGTRCVGLTVINAHVVDVNGSTATTRGGVRVQYTDEFIVGHCRFSDIDSGIGVRVLGCTDGIVSDNQYEGGQVVRVETGESNATIMVHGNRGATLSLDPTAVIARDNIGYVTEANGTATVANGATTAVVTHGLAQTPDLQDIAVTATNNLGNATKFWISTPTSTQFTITVDADPGAGTATFVWTASIQ